MFEPMVNKGENSNAQVLFVCTANVIETIPGPLLDRMEIIRLVGYISDEKMHIARDYLEPAARSGCGIKPEQVCMHIYWLSMPFFCHNGF